MILALAVAFPTYLAVGQAGGGGGGKTVTATVTITATPVAKPPGGGGGGGGGGAAEEEWTCPLGQTSTSGMITPQGLLTTNIVVESSDGRLRLTMDVGTEALTYDGKPISCIGIIKMDAIPPPEGAYLIGVMYDAIPDRATLSPTSTIRYNYKLDDLPAGVVQERLVIARYDAVSGKWINLDSVVDTEANTITTMISRFNDFAILGYGLEAPPPAAFKISSLKISPTKVESGETVNITLLVNNTGGQTASYQVILKINGVAETSKEVILDAGASQQVSFTALKGAAGTYSVDVNGTTGTFEVKTVLPPSEPFNWWLTAIIAGTVALAASLVFVFRDKIEISGITGTISGGAGKIATLTPKVATKVMAAISSLFSKLIKRG